MLEFKSGLSFLNFKLITTRMLRYIRNPETQGFLETVLQTAEKRVKIVPEGTRLWRAQLGCEEPHRENGVLVGRRPFEDARMKPLPKCAIEGRANPTGIPVLYLATDTGTAIAEVRPWISSYVSVGVFKTCRELKLVNCISEMGARIIYGIMGCESQAKLPPDRREECVWTYIDYAFAEPVTRNSNVADYASTQIIAELFKAHGYDGIAYRSSLETNGHNMAIFDLDVVKLDERKLHQVKSVKHESEEA